MTDTPKAVTLATMKQIAKERGIEPCCSVECDQIACYRAHWLYQEVHYCEPCAKRAERIASLGFGMSMELTRIPLPAGPSTLKRFAAIGADILNEANSGDERQ